MSIHPSPAVRNPMGVGSLTAGIGLLVWNIVFLVIQAATISRGDIAQLGLLGVFSGILVFVLAGVGLTCGIIGLVQQGRPRTLAGIGTGLAIAGLAGLANGLMLNVLIPLFGG